MNKLFLASSFAEVAPLFEAFAPPSLGKRVTFIPTASLVEKVVFYVKAGKKALESMGLVVDPLDVASASRSEIADKLANNDFIYITGGNTFYLLQELKKSGADKLIVQAVREGKLYIGESAGAMVTSPHIEYVATMDSVKKAPELKSFDAMALVDCYPVPHHTNAPFAKVVEKILAQYGSKLDLRPMSNTQALLVEGATVRYAGQ